MNAHSAGTSQTEKEISLVDALLMKLDDFENEVRTDLGRVPGGLSHH